MTSNTFEGYPIPQVLWVMSLVLMSERTHGATQAALRLQNRTTSLAK